MAIHAQPSSEPRDSAAHTGELASKDDLIRSHLRLVVAIAKRHSGRATDFMDLVSEGNAALVRAASRFRPERGVRFATYAFPWVEHAIKSACLREGDVISVPAGTKRAVYAYRRMLAGKEPGSEM